MVMSSRTFTWHPRRHWSCCSLRVKKPVSVGRMAPPPSSTWHLHMPQVPPPPHAEGRKMSLPESVESRLDPGETISSRSLIFRVTSPWGVSFCLAYNSNTTRSIMTSMKTTILVSTVPAREIPNIIFCLVSLKCYTQEAHEGYPHQPGKNKSYAQSAQRRRHIRVAHLLPDGCQGDNGQQPSHS